MTCADKIKYKAVLDAAVPPSQNELHRNVLALLFPEIMDVLVKAYLAPETRVTYRTFQSNV